MIRFDAKITGTFSQDFSGQRVSGREMRDAGSISREYGKAIRGRFNRAMRPALEAFDETILFALWVPRTGTPVKTGRLLLSTNTNFRTAVPTPIVSERVSWFITAAIYYAAKVNATDPPHRNANYFGRTVQRAIPRATQRAATVFAQNLN